MAADLDIDGTMESFNKVFTTAATTTTTTTTDDAVLTLSASDIGYKRRSW